MSIFVVAPNSFSKSLKTAGSSYSAQWKKFSRSSTSPPAEGLPPPPPGSGVSSPQAASRTPLENIATAEPARKCRRVIRSTVARDARTFTPSNSSVIRCLLSVGSGRGRVREDHRRLLRVEHVDQVGLPRAPDVPAHLELRCPRPWEPAEDLLLPLREDHELDHVAEVRDAGQRPGDRVHRIPRLLLHELHRLRPDRGQGGPAVDRVRRLVRRA